LITQTEAFRRRSRRGRTQEQISQEVAAIAHVSDLIQVELSVVASEFAATDEYDQQGFDSPISWIKANCHMGGGAAGDRVCVGNQLQGLPETATALAEGRIGFAHFALLAKTGRQAAATGAEAQRRSLLQCMYACEARGQT
jgi:hypothetical protein